MTPGTEVVSYAELADTFRRLLAASSRFCIIGGDCPALAALHQSIDRLPTVLDPEGPFSVLEREGKPPSTIDYREWQGRVSELLHAAEPQCDFHDACSALAQMDQMLSRFFAELEERPYLVIAKGRVAMRLTANSSAKRALVAAHVSARTASSRRYKGSGSALLERTRRGGRRPLPVSS